jgi:hypothetical protein
VKVLFDFRQRTLSEIVGPLRLKVALQNSVKGAGFGR